MRYLQIALTLLLCAGATTPRAADYFSLGVGLGVLPEFEGSADFETTVLPYLKYEEGRFVAETIGAGLALTYQVHPALKAGPFFRLNTGRTDVSDPVVATLPEIDPTVEVGLFGQLAIPLDAIGYDSSAILLARMTGTRDISGTHDGGLVSSEIGAFFELTKNLDLIALGQFSWADDDYLQSFYGVSPDDAAASGLDPFSPSSGFRDAGAIFILDYQMADDWWISGIMSYKTLQSDAARSPIVTERGDKTQVFAGILLEHRF